MNRARAVTVIAVNTSVLKWVSIELCGSDEQENSWEPRGENTR